jgi:hypothetical protein
MAGVQFQSGESFSLLQSVHAGSGAHPASYLMGSSRDFSRIKRPAHEADHSPPSSVKVKNDGAKPPFPHMSSWHIVYLITHRDNFNFSSAT